MGKREVNATVELTATEAANRLLPLLKEYAAKMAMLSEQVTVIADKFVTAGHSVPNAAVEAGRLICLHDTLDKPVTDLAREASGLIEHAALEYHLRGDLKLRLDELEEHIRFSGVMVGELVKLLKARKDQVERVRKLIEDSGRYKAPF